jgi:hypothetical protein
MSRPRCTYLARQAAFRLDMAWAACRDPLGPGDDVARLRDAVSDLLAVTGEPVLADALMAAGRPPPWTVADAIRPRVDLWSPTP